MNNLEVKIKNFVKPLYNDKDLMHDFSHINRVLKKANEIANNYDCDKNILIYSTYLHGVINKHYNKIETFLTSEVQNKQLRDKIILCAKESDKSAIPKTLEGKIIHDAHLLEGGIYYGIIKSFITGSLRGQSLHETIDYYKINILNKFRCALPENQKTLEILYKKSELILKDISSNI